MPHLKWRKYPGKGISTTKAGHLIKKHIPIRTFADWNDVIPGFVEADLVAHCGDNVRGQFLHTLTVTDIATGWTELGALMGKSEGDVLEELNELKELLPFPLLGFDSDNGGEFILFRHRNKMNSLPLSVSRPSSGKGIPFWTS